MGRLQYIPNPLNTDINFVHDFDIDGNYKGGITACYSFSKNYGKIIYAVARCHEKDLFNKREGRRIALEKARQGKVNTISFQDCLLFINSVENTFLKLHWLQGLTFDAITKEIINSIVILDCLRLLGKRHWNFQSYKDAIISSDLEEFTEINPVCLLCSKFEDFDSNENVCRKCNFLFLRRKIQSVTMQNIVIQCKIKG